MKYSDISQEMLGGETFHATMRFRWIVPNDTSFAGRLLQQMWQGDQGTEEWHTVPTVIVDVEEFRAARGQA